MTAPDGELERRNFSIIEERWPDVAATLKALPRVESVSLRRAREETMSVDGLQVASAYDRKSEAELQAEMVPRASAHAHIYGFALGDLPRALLARAPIERLSVVLLAPSVARESLLRFVHDDWLGDPRVELRLPTTMDAPHPPFAITPAELRLAPPASHPLRDAIVDMLDAPFRAAHWQKDNDQFAARIRVNSERFAGDEDIASLFRSCPNTTIAVCGGGPTLAAGLPWLSKHRARIKIVAATTALRPLTNANVTPDVAVALDPHPGLLAHLDTISRETLSLVTLAYSPIVVADLLEAWPGARRVFHLAIPLYESASRPRTCLFTEGTVAHCALDLAVRMGASRVVLFGLDFSYVGGQSHAEGTSNRKAVREDRAARFSIESGRGELVLSDANLIRYLRATEQFISRTQPTVRFVNASRDGALIRGTTWLADEVS